MTRSLDRRILGGIVAAHLLAATALTPGYLKPDSVAVFSWIRSFVFNGDLLFFDEWNGFGLIEHGIPFFKEVTAIGALANHWWVGASILSAPAYLLAHLLSAGADARNGFGSLYAQALAWSSVSFGAIASILGWRLLTVLAIPPRTALGAIAAVWLGSPMFWYEIRHPLGTHLTGILCVGILTALLWRSGEETAVELDLLIGLWFGLAVVTRLQHLFLAPAVVFYLWRLRRPLRSWAAVAAAAALPASVQGLAWTAVYGHPLGPLIAGSSPLGGTWMVMRTNALDEVIFSSWHGLVPWAPVLALAIAGWALELRRSVLAGTLLLMFAGEWAANGLLDRYFWGGLSFGPRRFVDLAVPFMIGLAWFLRRTRVAGAVAAAAATAWTVLLTVAAASGSLDLSRDLSGGELVAAVASAPLSEAVSILTRGSALARAPATALAGAAVALAVSVAGWWVARRLRVAAAATILLTAAAAVAAAISISPTHDRAPEALRRFEIRLPAATEAGPLLDARGLLAEEERFLRRKGRIADAEATARLLAAIDGRLRELRPPGGRFLSRSGTSDKAPAPSP